MLFMTIAAFLVIFIMCIFLVLIIMRCVEQVNQLAKESFLQHLSVYDDLIEKKSLKLEELREEWCILAEKEAEKQVVDSMEMVSTVVLENKANYVNDDFSKQYVLVKQDFQQEAKTNAILCVNRLVRDRKDINVHEFKEILNLFTYDLQYDMMSLSSEEQLQIMEIVVQNSVGKKRILNKYVKQHELFDFKEFMDFVREYIFRNDTAIYVYSHDGEHLIDDSPKHVLYQKEKSITEGYIVKYKDRIYDYSI